jgi:hypothetical protein
MEKMSIAWKIWRMDFHDKCGMCQNAFTININSSHIGAQAGGSL